MSGIRRETRYARKPLKRKTRKKENPPDSKNNKPDRIQVCPPPPICVIGAEIPVNIHALKIIATTLEGGLPTIRPCSKLTGFSCIRWIEPGNPTKT